MINHQEILARWKFDSKTLHFLTFWGNLLHFVILMKNSKRGQLWISKSGPNWGWVLSYLLFIPAYGNCVSAIAQSFITKRHKNAAGTSVIFEAFFQGPNGFHASYLIFCCLVLCWWRPCPLGSQSFGAGCCHSPSKIISVRTHIDSRGPAGLSSFFWCSLRWLETMEA